MTAAHRRRLGPGLIAVFCVVACRAAPDSGATVSVRDSAGITIVESRGDIEHGGGWALTTEPGIVIGSVDGPEETQLYRVRGALRFPDGRIAVATDGSQEIRIFGPDGTFVRRFGGSGEGPGEFTSVMLIGLVSDSLAVLDRQQRRVSLLHPDTGFVRSFLLAEDVANYPLAGWIIGGTSVLIRDLTLSASLLQTGLQRAPVPLRSSDMHGALRADFGTVPGTERVTVTRLDGDNRVDALVTVPFGKSPQIAVGAGHLFVGTQDAFEIAVYRGDGRLLRTVRLARNPGPVRDTDLEAYLQEQVAGMDANDARIRRQEVARMPHPDTQPAHGALAADRVGYLFVEDFRRPGAEAVAVHVFDPDGRLTGRFELPRDVQILDVGEDYLLGLYRDELDVEYLHVYDLVRPS